jgi:endonuclease/exonuclease/phosphatase family metal-dependent hydrolase
MTQTRFNVGIFNALNLVLPDVVYYEKRKYSKATFDEKTSWIAAQLDRMDADIVGFQEIFHAEALQQVLAKTAKHKQDHVIVANPTGTGPVVGLASRFPIESHEIISEFPESIRQALGELFVGQFTFSRPVLRATIPLDTANGPVPLTVFVVHLKSKRPILRAGADRDDPVEVAIGSAKSLMMRAAEALALRQIVVDTMRKNRNPMLLIGDINDSARAVTSEIISGTPPFKRLAQAKKAAIRDVLLHNVKDLQSRESFEDFYYTHIFNGHHESLDHIFVSDEFIRANPRHIGFVEYARVLNDHLIDETLSNDEVAETMSDHAQVVATIKMEHKSIWELD